MLLSPLKGIRKLLKIRNAMQGAYKGSSFSFSIAEKVDVITEIENLKTKRKQFMAMIFL